MMNIEVDITPFLYALCYDEWEDQYEPVMATCDVVTRIEVSEGVFIERVTQEEYDTGETKLVVAAGSRWSIRPDQCAWLEAAYQRRRSDRIEERLTALEKR